MTQQQLSAESVRQSKEWLTRYLKGFDDTNYTKQAPGLPNHVAWTLGHLALTMNRIAERLGGPGVPESDFAKGARGGDRFDPDEVGFGSKPVADPSQYPAMARCVAVFDAATERLATTVANASDARLDAPTKFGKTDVSAWTAATLMAFHNGVHCGQIVDLRRALGLGGILG